MGCDIHMHVEIKIHGVWHHWGAPSVQRDYRLFTKLAGIRDPAPAQETSWGPPRGLPEDITYITSRFRDDDGPDGHSDSWISRQEIAELMVWWEKNNDPRLSSSFELGFMGGYLGNYSYTDGSNPSFVEDVRCCFWFDN